MLKVLCFHGFGTNKGIIDYQLRQFKKFFKNVQFVTMNGPTEISRSLVADPGLIPLFEKTGQKCYSWFRVLHENPFVYLDQTMKFIVDFMEKEGPFDGVLGFSQGGTVACYFAYYCEFFKDKMKNISLPKFVIAINSGGFFPPQIKKKYVIEIPSIHFIGENDFLFSKPLFSSTMFKSPILLFHKEGHKIPKLAEHEINIIKEFFSKFLKKNEKMQKMEKNQISAKL